MVEVTLGELTGIIPEAREAARRSVIGSRDDMKNILEEIAQEIVAASSKGDRGIVLNLDQEPHVGFFADIEKELARKGYMVEGETFSNFARIEISW